MIEWTITGIVMLLALLMFWVGILYRKAEEQQDAIKQLTSELHQVRKAEATGLSSITRRFLYHKHGKCGATQVIVPEDIDYDLFNEEQC